MSREWEVLDSLRDCDNVVQMLAIYYTRDDKGKTVQNLIFEFCSQNLEDIICQHRKAEKPIPMGDIKNYMRQIL